MNYNILYMKLAEQTFAKGTSLKRLERILRIMAKIDKLLDRRYKPFL